MRLISSVILSAVFTIGLTARKEGLCLTIERFPTASRRTAALCLLSLTLAVTVFLPLLGFRAQGEADPTEISYPSLFLGHAVLAGFLAAWWGLSGFPRLAWFLHLRRPSLRTLRRGVLAGLAGWAASLGVMLVVGSVATRLEAIPGGEVDVPEVVRAIVGLPIAQQLLLILSAMVVEEAFFRSFLQARGGLLLSSILFAASHSSYGLPLMLVGVFAVSVVLGWVFRVTNNVLPCMIAHGVFDSVQLLLVLPQVIGAIPS